MFRQSPNVEGASTGVPTTAFRGCSAYVRQAKPGDSGFYLIRASGPPGAASEGYAPMQDPQVSIHLFVGDELDVALALDRLRIRKHSPHQNMESR